MAIKKHQLVKAWYEWLASEPGQSCLDISILRSSSQRQYLENRLWHAFQAGTRAQEEYLGVTKIKSQGQKENSDLKPIRSINNLRKR